MKKDIYVYPAVFHYDEHPGIGVTFPDLPGCVSHGDDEDHAYQMAQEALGLHLYEMEKDGDEIPEPTPVKDLRLEEYLEDGEKGVVVLVSVSMGPVRKELDARSVKKTLTIPKWLNDAAEKEGVNFSQVLQYALKEQLGFTDKGH
ncbi:type II toxin-antitoxin system HicB family antitoxin [Kyrpidia tusciae]|uniref:HicB-like antitoxin of toxin-antitoxin system domain-containing protein n=1 Tax=Kyrpidia tusciae (strain DSM 2912 / NBRC 15312 / T2) TaxID=562970 RepID=D5WU78_KYRT2|nr:type II toxin-antitoxin system HicB family antitoxin [Kyrpidia tusciae]ADG07330.1 protein of unknown function UPF0150 [Kyrpidia tusciae DSM 2912]